MAKFSVTFLQNIQRQGTVIVNITRDEVVEELGLEGEVRSEWRDHIDDFLNSDPQCIRDAIDAGKAETTDDGDGDFEIETVEEA